MFGFKVTNFNTLRPEKSKTKLYVGAGVKIFEVLFSVKNPVFSFGLDQAEL